MRIHADEATARSTPRRSTSVLWITWEIPAIVPRSSTWASAASPGANARGTCPDAEVIAAAQVQVPPRFRARAAQLFVAKLPMTWLASENVMSNVPE